MKQRLIIRKPNEDEQRRKTICIEQLAQDRQYLLMYWPFIGSVLMRMELVPVRDDRLDTASTDGDNIFVDIDFFSKLSRDERIFVLAHEVWHTALLHFARKGDRDRLRFNIAADLEIHFMLQSEKMKEPFVLPHSSGWHGLSAEEIYEHLPENLEDLKQYSKDDKEQDSPGKGSTKFGNGNSGFDRHIYSGDKVPDDSDCDDGSQEADNASGKSGSQDDSGSSGQRRELVFDEDYSPRITAESVERSRARTIAAAQQMERMQGKLPANIAKLLDKLQKPSLPWQEMLKQFVTTCYGGKRRWLPPARRHVWQDLYLPSMREEKLKAIVALDTSGSTQQDLGVFFAELISLMKSFGKYDLDVIQCDARVQNVEHFSDGNPPLPDRKWRMHGGGGTDFRPVFTYIRKEMHEKPDLLLFFTDGYGTAPDKQPDYPVMWLLTKDGKSPSGWGRVAFFKDNK
ncbi:MAG: hypothetical protein IJS15_12175 [Victivallales bacterium]|nr:hypothetical protein [Victivallales bacterium]